ncbi:class I SAM-dependent methyltransferase [Paenibacillus larvae]|uniref:tRNA (adenine(22)-N(1))-methyltransferase n=1 Tax=Paenibacillus larvae TaxID=1464 RepID=UPI002281CC10|nr:class I SAM-dependent methyltransferase [Paenibacillus larvae]MCY9509189.1 class I SAM-dependent methyltransferase [Paenibacillus larvae]MCY9524780.1 class I SAM-dependent methyltransferase [Paenibacillus larvae]
MVKLSNRLRMIADRVPVGSKLADIGSDHALLPAYLVKQGITPFAVAGEVNQGPREAAENQVKEAGLSSQIEVRLGDGLEVLSPGEVDTVTIAGMGGSLIVSILDAGKEKLLNVSTLVLQPNVAEDKVRAWLDAGGWFLAEETILKEDGKIYEILMARQPQAWDHPENLYKSRRLKTDLVLNKPELLCLGPYFVENPSPVWFEKWTKEISKLEKIAGQVNQSDLEAARQKQQAMVKKIAKLKEVLACLQKDRL